MKSKKTDALEKKEVAPPKEYTPAEYRMMASFMEKAKARHEAPKLKIQHNPGEPANISPSNDALVSKLALWEAFGTTSADLQSYLMLEMIDAACRGGIVKPYEESNVNGVIAAMHGIAPRDEIEGMLASQMVATHFAAMRQMRKMKNSETIPQQDSNSNLAIKLLRTYTAQMEALQRYRGKGQQKMTVEHVHVHSGGQAIVGNVTRPEGGGVSDKNEEQPLAK